MKVKKMIVIIVIILFLSTSCNYNQLQKEKTNSEKVVEENKQDNTKKNDQEFSTKVIKVEKFDELITYKVTYDNNGDEYMRERINVEKIKNNDVKKEAKKNNQKNETKEGTSAEKTTSKSNTISNTDDTDSDNPTDNLDNTEDIIKNRENIDFNVVEESDDELLQGDSSILQEGELGIRELTYKITYKNGEEVSRELIGEEVIKQPVDKIVSIGTKEEPIPDKWVIVNGMGNSGKYFATMQEAKNWAESVIWEGTPETNSRYGFSYTVSSVFWRNEANGETKAEGYSVGFRP